MQFKLLLKSLILFLPAVVADLNDFNPFADPPKRGSISIFSSGIISDQFGNRDMAISPAGNEMFWTLQQSTQLSVILYSRKTGGNWSEPIVAPFSGRWSDLEPAFSPDGNQLYFASRRPVAENVSKKDYDIWVMQKTSTGWSQPVHLPAPLNTEENEYYPSVNRQGDVFFTRDVGAAKEDILVARKKTDGYEIAVSLPPAINSIGYEFNAFVDPDEKFIIFTGYGRKDELGGGDLYLSKKSEKGEWEQAVNLGDKINSPYLDYCPFVSPDKKYFFFTSNRTELKQPFSEVTTLGVIKNSLEKNRNGMDDIYWTDLSGLGF